MPHTGQQDGLSRYLPAAVFGFSIVVLTCLLSTIQKDVFFSGDAGIKYLLVQQQHKVTSLRLEPLSWVSTIWSKGFYPFTEPFVYDRAGEKIVSFPPFFQLLSGKPFDLLGFAGLYLIPVLSLLLLWSWFTWLLYQLRLAPATIAFFLFLLTACSPLSFYAATFWEHTLAVLLFFSGIVSLLKRDIPPLPALLLGICSGVSCWLRPEALLLCAGLGVVHLYNYYHEKRPSRFWYLTAMILTIAGFLFFNFHTYGDVLGAHSYQLQTGLGADEKLVQSVNFLIHLNLRQILFFPLSVLIGGKLVMEMVQKRRVPKEALQLSFISMFFLLVTPFFVPNAGGRQWGARYFLFLVPLMLSVGALLFRSVKLNPLFAGRIRWVFFPVLLYSFVLNTYGSWKTLHDDYRNRVSPALQYLQRDSCKTIIVQNQYVAQEFAALFPTRSIFRAETRTQLLRLQELLRENAVHDAFFLVREKEGLLKCIPSARSDNSAIQLGDYYLRRCTW